MVLFDYRQDVLHLVDVVELLVQTQVLLIKVRSHFSDDRRRTDAIFVHKEGPAEEPWR